MVCYRVGGLRLFVYSFKVRAFRFPQRAIQVGILSLIPQKAEIVCLRPTMTFR